MDNQMSTKRWTVTLKEGLKPRDIHSLFSSLASVHLEQSDWFSLGQHGYVENHVVIGPHDLDQRDTPEDVIAVFENNPIHLGR
jgi:hypothetical protein